MDLFHFSLGNRMKNDLKSEWNMPLLLQDLKSFQWELAIVLTSYAGSKYFDCAERVNISFGNWRNFCLLALVKGWLTVLHSGSKRKQRSRRWWLIFTLSQFSATSKLTFPQPVKTLKLYVKAIERTWHRIKQLLWNLQSYLLFEI